ncbi:hypothetical protein Agabi119p4_8916 [Agaricus bisporus var. burnettii]|uniref:Uncharacterized protein n=1 Tax=Agaricus bisporus var. burnettii TaxID=192524 RepID=A0A8H7EXH7_AGABI|nr:hypothetical protein Agabi119p4_8916 [Agaricus bisporus var. burnettii]
MDNSTTTMPQGELLLASQLELISPTTVAGTFYGIAFTLFCLYVHSLLPRLQDGDRGTQARFMLAYSSILMICGLYILVANAWVTQDAYIQHADFPGSPYLYVVSTFHTQPAIIVSIICQLLIDVMTSAIQIWRVWVIWSATRYASLVIVLPSLCFLTLVALNLKTVVSAITIAYTEISQVDSKTQVAQSAIQGTTTVLCTVLISLYLVYQHWRHRALIGTANGGSAGPYMKIVSMLIESYVVESVWVLTGAILISHGPVSAFFGEGKVYIEIIAYLLVQYRVASGKSYKSQRRQKNISSLHWNHSNQVTTQFGDVTEAGGVRNPVSVKPEVDVLLVSRMA